MSVATAVKTPQSIIVPLTDSHIENQYYTPAALLDSLISQFGLKNDAALARALKLPPPVISKVRRKQVSITAAILLRIHEVTGWSISSMKTTMGIKSQFAQL